MKVIKVDSSNDQGAHFQPINFKEVFQELKASVEGKDEKGRDKKDIVKKYESLKIIGDSDDSEDEPKTCKKRKIIDVDDTETSS